MVQNILLEKMMCSNNRELLRPTEYTYFHLLPDLQSAETHVLMQVFHYTPLWSAEYAT